MVQSRFLLTVIAAMGVLELIWLARTLDPFQMREAGILLVEGWICSSRQ
jgi:hypothetical protein